MVPLAAFLSAQGMTLLCQTFPVDLFIAKTIPKTSFNVPENFTFTVKMTQSALWLIAVNAMVSFKWPQTAKQPFSALTGWLMVGKKFYAMKEK